MVIRQLQVERGTGKVRRPVTDVLKTNSITWITKNDAEEQQIMLKAQGVYENHEP